MPIILNDDNKATVVDITGGAQAVSAKNKALFTPKFFHNSVLTGHGGNSRGLLNEAHDPKMYPKGYPVCLNPSLEQGTSYNKDLKIYSIPFFILPPRVWGFVEKFDRPDPVDMVKVATGPNKEEVWLWMPIHAAQVEEKTTPPPPGSMGSPIIKRTLSACFHQFVFVIRDHADLAHIMSASVMDAISPSYKGNTFTEDIIFDMVAKLRELESLLTAKKYVVDKQAMQDFINDYSLYAEICKAAERWQTETDYYVADVMVQNIDAKYNHPANLDGYATMHEVLTDALSRLEKRSVPLDQYQSMYQKMARYVSSDVLNSICKANLNLKLSDTLQHMHANRASLLSVPCNQHIQGALPYSLEQRAAIESTSPLTLVQSGAGTGKALDLDTPVLTPSGWTKMRDLKVGSRIIGSDGKAHRVTHVWDHADKKAYELTFRDGSSVIACDEHLWATEYVRKGVIHHREITTAQWVNERKYRNYDFLPMVAPVQYGNGKNKKLPIDPYLLGALLADGCLGTGRIQYTKSEESVINAVRDRAWLDGFEMREVTYSGSTARQWRFDHSGDTANKSIIKRRLKALGLDVKSCGKFIPEQYKMASIEQRRTLLHGLFDGDGDVRTGRGYARYNTSSEQMANDVLQLLWSLGLSATKQRQVHSRGNYWSVNLLDGSWDPFLASKYKGKTTGSVRPMRRSLTDAKFLGSRPMRCIAVDAPDKLYVVKDFIVTHNSTVILGRIDHMIANGIDPDDITVLSFTNAAADHIVDMKPGIHSMTIASMLHTIYVHNYPNQQLSSLSTIINSIDIYFNNSSTRTTLTAQQTEFLSAFKYCLGRLRDNGEYTRMVNFVEEHMAEVLETLDAIEQTTLELESIICYLNMDSLVEPPEVQTKHLIIDEVQDNSVSEFIYSIKYTDKHMCSLYIVGKLRLPTLNPTNCWELAS